MQPVRAPDYWLSIAVGPTARLQALDGLLRRVWLDCCDHLSEFFTGDGQPVSMNRKISDVLGTPGRRLGYVYDAIAQKFYFDLTYDRLFVKGYFVVADAASAFDAVGVDGVVNGTARAWSATARGADGFDRGVIDGAVNGLAAIARRAGGLFRALQNGRLQTYQRLVVGAVVVLMLILVARGA